LQKNAAADERMLLAKRFTRKKCAQTSLVATASHLLEFGDGRDPRLIQFILYFMKHSCQRSARHVMHGPKFFTAEIRSVQVDSLGYILEKVLYQRVSVHVEELGGGAVDASAGNIT
jgi:hypothetical protein